MSASYLFRFALAISSLSLFTACVNDDGSEGPATRSAVASRTSGTVRTSDRSTSHEVAITDGRIRISVASERAAVTGQLAVAPGSSFIDLETVAAWRGSGALDVSVVGAESSAPGVITTLRADLVETVESNTDGIEQSWRFEQAPGAAGDLVIAVGAAGLDYLGSDTGGLHLRRAGELDVSYSHGTWIDGSGHASSVLARLEGGRILLTVPAAVVAGSTFPAVLDPKIVVTPIIS